MIMPQIFEYVYYCIVLLQYNWSRKDRAALDNENELESVKKWQVSQLYKI